MSSNESNEPNFEKLNNINGEQSGGQIEGFNPFGVDELGGSTLTNSGLNNQQNNAPESQENHEQEIPQLQSEKVDIIIEKKENYIHKEKYFEKQAENKNKSQIRPHPVLINRKPGSSPIIDYFGIDETRPRGKLKEDSKNYLTKKEFYKNMENSERRQINRFQNSYQRPINPGFIFPYNNLLRTEITPFFPNGYYFGPNLIPYPIFRPNISNAFPLINPVFFPIMPFPPR